MNGLFTRSIAPLRLPPPFPGAPRKVIPVGRRPGGRSQEDDPQENRPQRRNLPAAELRRVATALRVSIVRMLAAAGSGHTAGSLGMADVFAVLYFSELHHDPYTPAHPGRDLLFLSNGHICPVLYAALAEAGYFSKEELLTLRRMGSRLQGHPHRGALPGVENTSGPLGQGLSVAAGYALALKRDGKPNRVYCVASDGEHDEGQAWEAALFAAKYELDNLVVIMDRNHIQISGTTNLVLPLRSLELKYKAFNWHVIRVDGNDVAALLAAFAHARGVRGMPTLILADSIPGKGVAAWENDYHWHGRAPTQEQAEAAIKELEGAR